MYRALHPIRHEDGGLLPFNLILVVIFFIIGGIAVDVSSAYQSRTHLQVAADAAAHAALIVRETETMETAQTTGITIARESLPEGSFGDVIQPNDIVFGVWDEAAEVFTANSASRLAVMVETARIAARANAEPTYFLNFVGISDWNIRSQSVFTTYFPTCLREGFVAEDVIEVTSNNLYIDGFCIHSNDHVDLNVDNVFQTGTIVSMPDLRDLTGPSDMFEKNEGLEDALRDGSYKLRILQRIQDIYSGVQSTNGIYARDYITSTSVISLARNQKLDGTKFTQGRIHIIDCTSPGQKASIHNGTLLKEMVILTDCILNFGQGVAMEDVVIVNLNTSNNSFGAASGVRLGRDDGCAPGGGAQIVTMGGVNIPANLQMYGGQIIAAKTVSFTSNANGIQGASIVSGGRIDGTTNSVMAFCDSGMEDSFEAAYFKLVY